jgi:hypothetical protein
MEQPPDDPDAWTHEQWIAWLDATDTEADSERRVYAPRVKSTGGVILGAAMTGLHNAVYGEAKQPEIVIEAEADGHDDGMKVELDPDTPSESTVVVKGDAKER